jgi:hypothetical protein
MKRADWLTKVLLAVIAVGLWVLILKAVVGPRAVRAASKAAVPKVVRAQRFEVVDSAGRVAATLEATATGPQLALYHGRGLMPRATLALDEGAPALHFRDSKQNPCVALTLFQEEPALWLSDSKGHASASLSLAAGAPGLTLLGGTGHAIATLGVSALYISEGKGQAAARLAVLQGAPALSLYDGNWKERGRLFVDTEGKPGLALRDSQGKDRAVLGVAELETIKTGATQRTAESSLVLFDKEGKVIWEAP